MSDFHLHIASTLGILLGVCLAAGVFADALHLPKVTAYLLVGLLVGPSVLDWVPIGHVELFEPMLKLAMAVVLFNLGCEFTFTKVRRIAARNLVISVAEITTTFGLVTVGLLIFGCSPSMALLLGCLAVATAPATTILVLKDFRSEGPVTESTGFLVAMNNFACIVMFEFAFLAVRLIQGKLQVSLFDQLSELLLHIAGSFALGIGGGLCVSYGCGFLNMKRWLVLLVAVATFLLGVCESLNIPYMVTFLVMGVTVANTSDSKGKIVDELDHLSGLLAVLFFAVHGTELDVNAFLAAGKLGLIYIVFRIAVVGVIRYPLLSDVMFDHNATQLVRAEDLASENNAYLHSDEPASRAFELFQAETDDCIPVVTRTEPHELLGVVRRNDVMHALITQRRKTK